MKNSYRADQVGSLLRPAELLEAYTGYAQGRMPLDQLRQIEDAAILAALAMQQQTGIDVYSDGEYRRGSWAGEFSESVDGYVAGTPPIAIRFTGMPEAPGQVAGLGPPPTRVIGEKLQQKRRLTAHEASFLKQQAPGPFKITMPAASYVVARGYKPGVSDRAYPRRADALEDAAAIIRAEIEALVADGVPYIQLDNPHYPDYVDESRRDEMRTIGIDPDQALADDIAADNASLSGLDRGTVTLAMHLCRGNARSGWHTSGGYDRIAEQVFGGV
ncbi:MAG: uroporphyrinogen decarboxylase/cobalamine-independent methonine synthase family protein, partial [Dehalococcoidia bacterium]